MGERRTFRIGLKYLAISQPKIAQAILPFIPQYGHFDDALVMLDTPLAADVAAFYKEQLDGDLEAMKCGEPISLLAKWLPSINTSSAKQGNMRENSATILKCRRRNTAGHCPG